MYALMCEAERKVRPAVVRLLYLRDRIVVSATPTDQTMRGTRQRALGVWSAIERACREDDFRPNPSSLCRFCAFQAYCPCFGGDPALAAPALAAPALEAPPLAAPAVAVPALAATVLASPTLEAPGVSSVSLPA
jgi:putative RecB family exonuclease